MAPRPRGLPVCVCVCVCVCVRVCVYKHLQCTSEKTTLFSVHSIQYFHIWEH